MTRIWVRLEARMHVNGSKRFAPPGSRVYARLATTIFLLLSAAHISSRTLDATGPGGRFPCPASGFISRYRKGVNLLNNIELRCSADVDNNNPAAESRVPPNARVVRSIWASRIFTFLAVVGPGIIVMEADNDAGAVSTYTQAGAQYGIHLLWLMLLLLPVTYFIQEMVVRLGIATGEGHAAMIYKRFGKWWGIFSLVDLQIVNFLTLVTEFAAIALAVDHMGISPRLGVPAVALGLTMMVSTGSYRRWERVTVFLCCSTSCGWRLRRVWVRPSGLSRTAHSFPISRRAA